jgi:hypothetical protein
MRSNDIIDSILIICLLSIRSGPSFLTEVNQMQAETALREAATGIVTAARSDGSKRITPPAASPRSASTSIAARYKHGVSSTT